MKTTVSDRLTNRQLFELCKKEFSMNDMKDPIFNAVYNKFDWLNSNYPDSEWFPYDALDRWAVQYTLNYSAPIQ